VLLIYPDKLPDTAKVKMILDHLEYPYTYDKNVRHKLVFNSTLKPNHEFGLETKKFVINGRCTNVLKDHVDKVWGKVYGSCLLINPRNHTGRCIEKPLGQGTNSGNIVMCPVEPKNGKVYLRWVDTRDEQGNLTDYRVVICDKQIILCLLKKKPSDRHFSFDNKEYIQVAWNYLFSVIEKDSILSFCDEIGLDFGEIDVLRSNFDGKIYVVDVNNISGYGYFRIPAYLEYVSQKFKMAFLV